MKQEIYIFLYLIKEMSFIRNTIKALMMKNKEYLDRRYGVMTTKCQKNLETAFGDSTYYKIMMEVIRSDASNACKRQKRARYSRIILISSIILSFSIGYLVKKS